jgi:nicotinamidase-related amidase
VLEVAGKPVPVTLEEVITPPRKCAVIAVDLQNDFCHPDGAFGRIGTDTSAYPAAVDRTNDVIRAGQAAGALIVFLLNTTYPDCRTDSPAQLRLARRALQLTDNTTTPSYTVDQTWGHQLVDGLFRPDSAIMIKKHRSSGFWGTSLDMILRSNGIRTVVVVGCTTEGCVDSTVRDAGFLDYFPVVVSDAVASTDQKLHDAALFVLGAYRADIVDTHILLRMWETE